MIMATFTNQARLSYNNTVVNSNRAVGEILDVLTLGKTAVVDTYSRGDDITFILSLVNSGAAPLTGITVTDNMGGYPFGTTAPVTLYPMTYRGGSVRLYTNGVLGTPPEAVGSAPVVFSGITLPAGGNVMLIYEAEVNGYAPLAAGDSITNTASASGAGVTAPVTASETISVSEAPALTITKTIEPVPVAENGTLTYTFFIQNSGNAEAGAADNVILSDTFDPALSNLSVTYNGTPWTTGTDYQYEQTNGGFTSAAGAITVPPAVYTQDPATGEVQITPGSAVVTVSGTV